MIELDNGINVRKVNLDDLKKPFKTIHFRPKTCYDGKVLLLAYLDSRDVMKRLDDVVGAENWSCDFKEVRGNLYCSISLHIGNQIISKVDCGVESNIDKEKGESSDAFKRAAVKWGIGRYLYYLKNTYVEVKPQGKNWIKIKDNKTKQEIKGYYDDPQLPVWAQYKEPEKEGK